MCNIIESADAALRQTFAHELGHLTYAFSAGMPWVLIKIWVVRDGQAFTLPARAVHNRLQTDFDLAALGLSGVIAQEMFLNSNLNNPTLFNQVLRSPSLSATDRSHYDHLAPEEQSRAFQVAAQTIRPVLPHIRIQIELLLTRFWARYAAGEVSMGFYYTMSNQQLIFRELPIAEWSARNG